MDDEKGRREFLKIGSAGLVMAGMAGAAAATLTAEKAAAQSAPGSLLRTVLDRGKLIVGTGSTNAPWHFENEQGELVGMDITMAQYPGQGPVRRPDQGRVRHAGSGAAHPQCHHRQGRHHHPVHDHDAAALATGQLLAALLRRGRCAADASRRREQDLRRVDRRRRRHQGLRSCRMSMPRARSITSFRRRK